jgi:ATP synthase F1 complex assembly factor 1
VHDVRFFAAHQRPDKVLEKYKEKLEQKAKEEGLRNAEELRAAHAQKIEQLRKKAIVPGANAPLSAQAPPSPHEISSSIPYQPPPPPTPQESPSPQPKKKSAPIRTLDSFIDVEAFSTFSIKDIERGWRLRHASDEQSLCALVAADTFQRVAKTAKAHPQFILPLPKEGQGAEIHFLQWAFPTETTATVLFTGLAEFKLRGEFAQPHTTITYHRDMEKSNGVILLEGRVQENRGIAVDEAKWLLMCLQKFYGFEAKSESAKVNFENRQKLMRQFSGGDENFKLEELLEEAEKVP